MGLVPLATSRYAAKKIIIGHPYAPVRTSIGAPKFDLSYTLAGECRLLAPRYNMLKLDRDAYFAEYTRILERCGVDRIQEEFERLSKTAGNRGLILLCFEDLSKPGKWCHRRMFAEWWEQQTGQAVPELSPPEVPKLPAQGYFF